jgi:hypothetical protein
MYYLYFVRKQLYHALIWRGKKMHSMREDDLMRSAQCHNGIRATQMAMYAANPLNWRLSSKLAASLAYLAA